MNTIFRLTTRDPRLTLVRGLSFDRTGRRLLIASVAATALGLAAPAGAVHQWFESAKNWTGGEAFTGSDPWSQTLFADVNGDRKTDALAVKYDRIWVRYSDGCRFGSTKKLTSGPFVGTEQTAFGDVTGDQKADAIAIDREEIRVRRSENGAVVKTPTIGYLNQGVRHYFEDVGGTTPQSPPDGRADLIAHRALSSTVVKRSLGAGKFGPQEYWTSGPFGGELSTHFADVDGDQRADAIAVNYSGVMVHRGRDGFFSESNWTPDGPVYGHRWEFFVDVTGDRKADLVMDNWDGLAVRHSLGSRFASLDANNLLRINNDAPRLPWGYWTEAEVFGNNGGTGFADVDGDGDAEPIAIGYDGLWVRRNQFRGFSSSCP